MIRYPLNVSCGDEAILKVQAEALKQAVENECPGWIQESELRTAHFAKLGCFDESDFISKEIWVRIKPFFTKLQHGKCGYCESKPRKNTLQLEHFRPKKAVTYWPTPNVVSRKKLTISFSTGRPGKENGYFSLAYAPGNFLLACESCNKRRKGNYFPISGKRCHGSSSDPMAFQKERPLLPYPIGGFDQAPEELITFDALVAKPVSTDRRTIFYRRAYVTIAIFDLALDEDLLVERALFIVAVFGEMKNTQGPPETVIPNQMPHANCLRSFLRVYRQDKNRADQIVAQAKHILDVKFA